MNVFSLLLLLLVIVLYAYLILVKKELVFVSKRRSAITISVPLFAVGALFLATHEAASLWEHFQGILAALLIFSFFLDSKGLANERIVSNAMDIKGIPYGEVNRVVLLANGKQTKLNFFRRGMRGPLLVFDAPVQDVVVFLAERLTEGTPIEVIVEEEK